MGSRRGRYFIGVAARMAEMHPTSLRKYERAGLLEPARTGGNVRLYSDADVQRLRQIKRLVEEWGMSMMGVERALAVSDKIRSLREMLVMGDGGEGTQANVELAVAELLSLLGQEAAASPRRAPERRELVLTR